jgi:hypothetical protein
VAISVEFPDKLLDAPKELTRKLPGAMRRIAMEGKSFWKAEAGRKLKSSRTKYQEAINFQVIDDLSFYLSLEGSFAYGIEVGRPPFDMKPGLMKNALPWPPKKRKFPSDIRHLLRDKSPITRYKIIPLNVNRYVNMTKPKVFRTIHDQTEASAWQHPGNTGVNLAQTVVDELVTRVIPTHMSKLLQETF